jgi:hypothetical protein
LKHLGFIIFGTKEEEEGEEEEEEGEKEGREEEGEEEGLALNMVEERMSLTETLRDICNYSNRHAKIKHSFRNK